MGAELIIRKYSLKEGATSGEGKCLHNNASSYILLLLLNCEWLLPSSISYGPFELRRPMKLAWLRHANFFSWATCKGVIFSFLEGGMRRGPKVSCCGCRSISFSWVKPEEKSRKALQRHHLGLEGVGAAGDCWEHTGGFSMGSLSESSFQMYSTIE